MQLGITILTSYFWIQNLQNGFIKIPLHSYPYPLDYSRIGANDIPGYGKEGFWKYARPRRLWPTAATTKIKET